MSRKDIHTCDFCNGTSWNPYDEEGWVIIRDTVCLTDGRNEKGTAIAGFMSAGPEFCSFKCLMAALKRAVAVQRPCYRRGRRGNE